MKYIKEIAFTVAIIGSYLVSFSDIYYTKKSRDNLRTTDELLIKVVKQLSEK